MPCQGRSRRRRGPTASLYGAWRSAKLGHWDRRLNATQSGNFKPLVFGEIHAAGNNQQLARHRPEIEAEIDRLGELSLRAAVRLIAKPKTAKTEKSKKTADLIAALNRATDAELTAALSTFNFERFLRVMPAVWRRKLEERVLKQRAASAASDAEPFLKASEVLRRALSLVRGPDPTAHAVNEAIAALRKVAVLLAGEGIDEITVVRKYAKERRRAA